MIEKMTSAIESITLNAATFSNEGFEPTCVNFFFGRNGTGKSTLAEAIKTNAGLQWRSGTGLRAYNVLAFDRDFITRHFSHFDELPGVFTVHEQNIQIQKQIDEAGARMAAITEIGRRTAQSRDDMKAAREKAIAEFQEVCWSRSKKIRKTFPEALKGRKTKALFVQALLTIPRGRENDVNDLKGVYDVAFDSSARVYPLFQKPGRPFTYPNLPGYGLLHKRIASSSDTDFARFIRALNATDWVRQGHEHYGGKAADGRCPYCQQKLPKDFEGDIAACFDDQYRQDIDDLKTFQATYATEISAAIEALNANLRDAMPSIDLSPYRAQLALMRQHFAASKLIIEGKLINPSSPVTLADFEVALHQLDTLIDAINAQISRNNAVVNHQREQQDKCRQDLWEHLSFMLADDIRDHKRAMADFDREINRLEGEVKARQREYIECRNRLKGLNRQGVNTSEAIENINHLLRDADFQGFSLRPRSGMAHTYEVVRPGGQLADKLSEGEKNFVAFLYFCQLVHGNGQALAGMTGDDADSRSKILVIDDPVSGLDSSALFIVSSLVREMVELCYTHVEGVSQQGPGGDIVQLFILTHNAQFHREVTCRQVGRYRGVSFFLIQKINNVSTVKLCQRKRPGESSEMENYNPVQDSYAAL